MQLRRTRQRAASNSQGSDIHWRQYLIQAEHRIRILTDYQNLIPFTTTKTLVGRQCRWSEILSEYWIKIEYRPGREGGKPDALTRREGDLPKNNDERIEQRKRILLPKERYFDQMEVQELTTVTLEDDEEKHLKDAINNDEQLARIKEGLKKGEREMRNVALGLCEWKDNYLWYQGKIWIPDREDLRTAIIRKHHDVPQAGHGGTAKTTELIKWKYYWPKMRETITRYVKNCDTCQRIKVVRPAPYGMLQPNEIPMRPWQSIAMDFITDLPISDGYDSILVVIDRLTKMSHFVACRKDLNAKGLAALMTKEIFRLHGIPKDIISDRGTLFTSEFWKQYTKEMEIERRMSTAFHPQTDGQTEPTNAILEQYLRAYINYQQDNWNQLLPMAEFAYNNGYQETIKTTPFFANYAIHPEYESIGHTITGQITPSNEINKLHETFREEMSEAQSRHKENYDQHRKPDPNLKSGDMVWFLPRNVRTTRPSRKLDYKKIGPFEILDKTGMNTYRLKCPPTMKIHNNIHISLLEPYYDNQFPSQRQEPPPPIIIDGEPEYELEEIIDSRLHHAKLQYRAKWKGYSPEHDKVWYPANNFENAQDAVRKFHQQYPDKPSQDRNQGATQRRTMGASLRPTYAQVAQATQGNHSERDHTNQPGILPGRIINTNGHKSQMSGCGIQLASLLRRRVLDPADRQGRGILPTRPSIRCCELRLGDQAKPPNRTQEVIHSSWVERGYNGTPHHEMADLLLRQLLNTREREKEGRALAQKTKKKRWKTHNSD